MKLSKVGSLFALVDDQGDMYRQRVWTNAGHIKTLLKHKNSYFKEFYRVAVLSVEDSTWLHYSVPEFLEKFKNN